MKPARLADSADPAGFVDFVDFVEFVDFVGFVGFVGVAYHLVMAGFHQQVETPRLRAVAEAVQEQWDSGSLASETR